MIIYNKKNTYKININYLQYFFILNIIIIIFFIIKKVNIHITYMGFLYKINTTFLTPLVLFFNIFNT